MASKALTLTEPVKAVESWTKAKLSQWLKDHGLKCTGSHNALQNRVKQALEAEGQASMASGNEEQEAVAQDGSQTESSRQLTSHYCYIPLCHNRSGMVLDDGHVVSLHRIPSGQNRKAVRRQWILRIRQIRKNVVINDNIRICSAHFEGHNVHPEAVPTIFPSKQAPPLQPRRQIQHSCPDNGDGVAELTAMQEPEEHETAHQAPPEPVDVISDPPRFKEIGVQVGSSFCAKFADASTDTAKLPDICFEDIQEKDDKVRFYTGFVNFATFMLTGRKRTLRPVDEFLLVCMRLRLGILQEHLADIFKVSQATVSRTLTTWLNFLYDHCKGLIPWPRP